ncbi:MAG: MlaD family protein [Bacteroidetes bacterium]|nr:MlaD family protein [Bacteroidota bacterium]
MEKDILKNIRLGVFVLFGAILLIIALYVIGNKRNLFGKTFSISAKFYNVNGLMKGKNVRFAGIDVGTVELVEIVNDSSVNVIMIIEKALQKFIKKNALASVGTDGLMGNKLVNINVVDELAPVVEDGDELRTLRSIETDEMTRTLNVTNENIKLISANVRDITDKLSSKNSLLTIFMDTVVAENIKAAILNIKDVGGQAVAVVRNFEQITKKIKDGKGTIGSLITDSSLFLNMNQVVTQLQKVSDTAGIVVGDITSVIGKIKVGDGSVGNLLTDTTFVHNLNQSVKSINSAAKGFDENMEALKHTILLRRYYKKQDKQKSN